MKVRLIKIVFPVILLLFLVGASCAVWRISKHVAEKRKETCLHQMVLLWDTARSCSLEQGIRFDKKWTESELAQLLGDEVFKWNGSELVRISGDYVVKTCPLGDQPYPRFTVLEGPICPYGHDFSPESRRTTQKNMETIALGLWQSESGAPPPVAELLDALKDQNAIIRESAIQSLMNIHKTLHPVDPDVMAALEYVKVNDETELIRKKAEKAVNTFQVKEDMIQRTLDERLTKQPEPNNLEAPAEDKSEP